MSECNKLPPTPVRGQLDVGVMQSQQAKPRNERPKSVECKPRITQCTCKGPCNSKEYPTNLDFISDQTATESSNCRSRLTHCSQSEPSHSKHQIDDLDSVSKQGSETSELVKCRSSTAQYSDTSRAELENHLTNPKTSQSCKSCSIRESRGIGYTNLKWCTGCFSVKYCSTVCQKKHWSSHKVICAAIQDLESSQRRTDTYDHFTQKQTAKVVKLVGRKCLIRCSLGQKMTDCLWDTGAMVSLLSEGWIRRNFSNLEIRGVRELLDEYPGLDLTAANGSKIPFIGWVELDMELAGGVLFRVPFLVTKTDLEEPLIGYNVVETIINEHPENETILTMFPGLELESTKQLINAIQNRQEDVAQVFTTKKDFQLAAGETAGIRCKANAGQFDKPTPMMFEPNEE